MKASVTMNKRILFLLTAALLTNLSVSAKQDCLPETMKIQTGETLLFDFGETKEDGWIYTPSNTKYNKDTGYGFSMISFNDNVPSSGNNVLSDAVKIKKYGNDGVSFNVDLPSGMYEISVYSGNIRYITIGLEGHPAIVNIESPCSEARVEIPVTDGQLNMTFLQGNSGTDMDISAMSIKKTGEIESRRKRVFVCGDSTAATFYPLFMYQPLEEGYRGGWGQMLENFIPDSLYIHNLSASGQTAKGFIESGQLNSVLYFTEPGDYAVIAYGINDYNEYSADEFTKYMTEITEKIIATGGIPIITSSVGQLDNMSSDGTYTSKDNRFMSEAKAVAQKFNVKYINFHDAAAEFFKAIGYQSTKSLYWTQWNGEKDNLHPNRNGAGQLARLFTEECIKEGLTDFGGAVSDYGLSNDIRLKCSVDKNTVSLINTTPSELKINIITNNYRNKTLSKSDVVSLTLPPYDVLSSENAVVSETLLYDMCNKIYVVGDNITIPLSFKTE